MVSVPIAFIVLIVISLVVFISLLFFFRALGSISSGPIIASRSLELGYGGQTVRLQQTISTENDTDSDKLLDDYLTHGKILNEKIVSLIDAFTIIAWLVAIRIALGAIKTAITIIGRKKWKP